MSSFAHHYNLTIDEATETMLDNSRFMEKTVKNSKVFLVLGNLIIILGKHLEKKIITC